MFNTLKWLLMLYADCGTLDGMWIFNTLKWLLMLYADCGTLDGMWIFNTLKWLFMLYADCGTLDGMWIAFTLVYRDKLYFMILIANFTNRYQDVYSIQIIYSVNKSTLTLIKPLEIYTQYKIILVSLS